MSEILKRLRLQFSPEDRPDYTFCESVHSSGLGLWCIRKNTEKGPKFGGGIDSDSLCGRVKSQVGGWDLNVCFTDHHLEHNACKTCLASYRQLKGE